MSKKKTPPIDTVFAVFYEKNDVWYLRSIHKTAESAVGEGFELYRETQRGYKVEEWVLHT